MFKLLYSYKHDDNMSWFYFMLIKMTSSIKTIQKVTKRENKTVDG